MAVELAPTYRELMRLTEIPELLKITLADWWQDNTFRLAASLAFYTIFSMAPILLIAIGIAGFVFGRSKASHHIVSQVTMLVGAQGASVVREVIQGAEAIQGNPVAIAIGLITMVIGSTIVFAELQSALNKIWDIEAHPDENVLRWVLRVRLRSFAIVLVVGFLLLVSLMLSAFLAAAQDSLDHSMPGFPWLWRAVNLVLSFALVATLFAMIYKYLPDARITWRDVAVGSLVTAGLFSIGKYVIGLYLGQMAFGSTYGAAGSLVVLVVWVYYSALVSFFGAEFTQVYARRYGSHIHPQPHAVRVGRKSDAV